MCLAGAEVWDCTGVCKKDGVRVRLRCKRKRSLLTLVSSESHRQVIVKSPPVVMTEGWVLFYSNTTKKLSHFRVSEKINI